MEKLEHPLWIVQFVNALLGPLVLRAGEAVGYHFATPHEPIPPFMVMVMLIVLVMTVLSLIVRSRLSVEIPGSLQIVLEDVLRAVLGLLEEWIGPKGHRFLPLIATLGMFILLGNYMGLVPGLMAPTSSINVTLGCAHDDLGLLPLPGHPRERDRRSTSSTSGRRPARRGGSASSCSRSS